jgi:2-keto-4-pentenoate hydratase/2-oxohepta-3-ene-1,7-dioic acid hydratase in catechol pathway
MRFLSFQAHGRTGIAVLDGDRLSGLLEGDPDFPGTLEQLIQDGRLDCPQDIAAIVRRGQAIELAEVECLPPVARPGKIICLGLNYRDHADEGGFQAPSYPVLFSRFPSSMVGHDRPLVRPAVSVDLDFEGELVAIIGKAGKHVSLEAALDHVAGYSVCNDGSIRDFQMKTPQWTVGKNFDGTGGFGPYFVPASELPLGAAGLHIETRVNGQVVQSANTRDMIFDVKTTICLLSRVFALQPGDVILMGTPSGVGFVRTPQLFLKPGDICEVEIDGIGLLRNPVIDEIVGEPRPSPAPEEAVND